MAKDMAKEYRVMEEGMYPVFPHGSRMQFMPNHKLVPFSRRVVLETYANLQVTLKKEALELDTSIKDSNQRVMGSEKT